MTPSKLTVWYNTKCPVCNTSIDRKRRRIVRAARDGVLEFRNINVEPDALADAGVGIEDVRRRLYGIDGQGRLHRGADCAIEIWRRLPGEEWLAKLLGRAPIRPLVRLAYDRFADLLYAWNRRMGHW